MTLAPFRSFTAAQRGVFTPPTFAALSSYTFEFWVKFASPLTNGHIVRIGSPTDGTTHKTRVRVGDLGRIILLRTVGSATQESQSDEGVVVPGTWYHIVAVFPNNANHQLYVNGEAVTLTHTGSAINGALSIASTDEFTTGDPSPSTLAGFIGDLGRVTLWPFSFGTTRATVSYRHQSDPVRWIGRGGTDLISDTNKTPVPAPVNVSTAHNTAITVDVRPTAYDPEGDTLTVVSGSVSVIQGSGSVSLTSGNINFTPASGFSGQAILQYTLRDSAGNTAVGRVYVQVAAAPAPTGDLFDNPFDKDSVHHRPVGLGAQIGIAPGLLIDTTNNIGGGVPYDTPANIATVDAAMDRIGRIVLSANIATFKYMHRVPSTTTNTRKVGWRGNRLPCSSGGGVGFGSSPETALVNVVMPAPGTVVNGDTIAYPPSNINTPPSPPAGDNSVMLWPKNGGTADIAVLFNEFRYDAPGTDYTVGVTTPRCSTPTRAAPTGQQSEARFIREYPLSGTDIGNGSGASSIKSPSMYLRWIDLKGGTGTDPDPGPIYHAFQVVGTRQRQGQNGTTVPYTPGAHILSKRRCWPSQDYDGGSDGAANPNNNLGPFPYGQRFWIPKTTANLALRNDGILCTTNIHKRIFDALMYYGFVLVDGHGTIVTNNSGELRLRIDNLIPNSVQTSIENFFARLVDKKILKPMYNPRSLNSETERYNTTPAGGFGDGICFAGGGGPVDSNSVNNSIVP